MKRRLRQQSIYSVYLRNHSPQGNIRGLIEDLDRIKELGCNWIWLLPIHPIGREKRKGSLGSPYAISNYRKINEEYGTMQDFEELAEAIHKRDMKLMIDVVYNHTSPDSILFTEQPSWFYRKGDGQPGNRVGEWTDIIDLEYRNRELWDYQIETLVEWSRRGVDGFRCDVAPLVPLQFWLEARETLAKENPQTLWLAETTHPGFVEEIRHRGFDCLSDSQCFQAFDICYDYDGYDRLEHYARGKIDLKEYLCFRRLQESIYPADYCKLRFVENHDVPRMAYTFPLPDVMMNWLAFSFFDKGCAMVYGGQERCDPKLPSLFEKDPVNWEGPDVSRLIARLNHLRQHPLRLQDNYQILELETRGVIAARYQLGKQQLWGIFNVEQKQGTIKLPIPDGEYSEELGGGVIDVHKGLLTLDRLPHWFSVD